MLIACLGWGSLVWDARGLPLRDGWLEDGPPLHIEFGRQSSDQRLTLVIAPDNCTEVRSLWALLAVANLDDAREALRLREGTVERQIGALRVGMAGAQPNEQVIQEWARPRGLDAVIWTALPPRLGGREVMPTEEEAVGYLRGLSGEPRQRAESYIRRAPAQIDTAYRRRFQHEFGWTPLRPV